MTEPIWVALARCLGILIVGYAFAMLAWRHRVSRPPLQPVPAYRRRIS